MAPRISRSRARGPSRTVLYSDSYLTAFPGPLSSGGCGWASPIVPGGRSLLVCLVSTRCIVVANAAMIATATTAAKIANVICVRRRLPQLRSLFMDNTSKHESTQLRGAGSARRPALRVASIVVEEHSWEAAMSFHGRSAIGRPEAGHGMGDHDAIHRRWAISGLMAA